MAQLSKQFDMAVLMNSQCVREKYKYDAVFAAYSKDNRSLILIAIFFLSIAVYPLISLSFATSTIMRIHSISLLAAIAVLGQAKLSFGLHIPDGIWIGYTFPNGTMVTVPHDQPDAAPLIIHARAEPEARIPAMARSAKLGKRLISCWGTPLDHAGVDAGADRMRSWAGNGRELTSGPNSHAFVSAVVNGVRVYYCIDWINSSGNLSANDVNFALGQMDSKCPWYTSSYYQWDNTPEIFGKALANTAICVGGI
jgi:hypothetical protein